ncbi:unnamed protein product [Dicrocoelium dendriticum]|nr:unnamed protein product [Dicrocoelium dendriticum]
MSTDLSTASEGPFVAAFAQANEGDVSPNTAGARCIDTGKPCDLVHSICDGHASTCIAFGPGRDMFESTKIIASKQMQKAWELFTTASEELTGPVSFVHQFVDMTNISVRYQGRAGFTCKPAMGYSFAAGTTDGPGDFNFEQGTTEGSVLWNMVRSFLKTPSAQLEECHKPKPILFATGEIDHPLPWQPAIVETQILRIGQLLIVALPGEFTTMSGRRIRNAVEKIASPHSNIHIALAGLSNVYSSYVATPEEYMLQRYEGASTIYGPLTLPAYVQQYEKLASALLQNQSLPPGPRPPNYLDEVTQLLPPVLLDTVPWGHKFGDVMLQPNSVYDKIDDVVTVRFHSANPRNNLRQNDTFLKVELYDNNTNTWTTRFTDANWETK